ncbi:MAG: TonB-dependent receptor [Phenylobacterium sp.]|nr:TonB-dependent receptor [Phenylobacterium sp.]
MSKRSNHRVHRRLAGLAGAAIVLSAGAAAAQPTHPIAVEAAALEPALLSLASQTGQQILFSKGVVAGRRAPAVSGQMTPEQALAQLLAGTDLQARRVSASLVVVERRPERRAPGREAAPERPFGEPAIATAGEPAVASQSVAGAVAVPTLVEAVEVTGTHLRGVTNSPSPVLVLDRDALARSGHPTVAEALRVLPQNFAGAGTEAAIAAATDRSSANSFYATGVNLRGLGPNATLTLLNGHRLAGTGGNGDFADLSTLPTVAVERVEVLLDGASALYGSDAVGGVVNVIMRRRYDGAETRVSAGSATQGSPTEFQAAQILGRTWSGGGVTLAFEHTQRGLLLARQRSYTRTADLRAQGGTDHRLTFAHPGNILWTDPVTGLLRPYYAIPTGQTGVGLTPDRFQPDTVNLGEPSRNAATLPRQVSDSLYASLSQSVGSRIDLTLDATAGRRRFRVPTGAVNSTFNVTRANPFFVSPVGAASHFIQYAFVDDLPPSQLKGSTTNLALTAGADVRLAGDWRLAAFGAYGEVRSRTAQTGLLNSTAFAEALGNVADNPATPYSPARDGFFNPFGDGAVNAAVITDFIGAGYSTSQTRNRVTSGDAKLDGTLFELSAGPVRLAVGAAARREQFRRRGVGFTSGLAPTPGRPVAYERDVTSAYVELRAPLLAEDSPVGGLEVSLAGRLERYSDFGSTEDPKLGLIWTPTPDLRLRASYGTSFRAPSLPQLFGQQIFASNRLPRGDAGTVQIILLQGGNPTLTPETATSWSLGFDYAPAAIPGLKVSGTWFDTDFTNRIDQPVRQALGTALTDPAYADFVDFVAPAASPADLARVQALIAAPEAVGLNAFAPTAFGAIVDARFVNTGSLRVAGFDAQVAYAFDLRGTDIQLGLNGAYLDRYDAGITPGGAILDRLNLANFPLKFRGRAWAGARRGALSGQVAVNLANRYRGSLGERIGGQVTADLQVRAEAPAGSDLAGLSATLNLRNAFNRKPPFYDSPAGVAYDVGNADVIGRHISLQLVKVW